MLLNSDREEITFLIRTPGQTNHLNTGFHILRRLFQCDWLQYWPLKDCHMSSWVWGATLTTVIYFAAAACMFSIADIHPEFFLLFTWLSFVSCNLFVYGCNLSRTPLKMKLLVSKVWFVLVNLSTIENSTSSFKDVQGSTIFWFPHLMITIFFKPLSLASSPTYSVLLKIIWKTFICHIIWNRNTFLFACVQPLVFYTFSSENIMVPQCTLSCMSWILFPYSLSWIFHAVVNLLMRPSIPLLKSLMNELNNTGPSIDPLEEHQ